MRGKEGAVDRCKWVSLEKAASHLGLNAAALRKTLERRALRSADGVTEAALDGVSARKFGRLWRVRFSEAWGVPVSSRRADAGAVAREGSRS
ncbi:hypothetical protein [Polyangium sp. 15x6]|uniref:hypothetical protein n=1 Tax=Polyangium sp. 15x6 TaxID=3042687 RepID=UPI00249B2B0D|nr:hypothetical protein [Polyangium sp. 15x6]MDI3291001.1 hypothetical protein [Polyangium sp. 15x6]